MQNNAVKLSPAEQQARLAGVRARMAESGIDAMLISDFADIYYLTGGVFAGYVWVDADSARCFVRRPVNLRGTDTYLIRKPEEIPAQLGSFPATVGLELDLLSANAAGRLAKALAPASIIDCTGVMRRARAVKTASEQELMRRSGLLHEMVYRAIPGMFEPGITDVELQIAIEHALRLKGCLGLFRISGDTMEMYMGSVIAGDNADTPSPYDFAMGGAGMDSSLPVGADGTVLRPGVSVMVDMCGNFTGYMTDMSRTFAVGRVSEQAEQAHELSRAICRRVEREARPGVKASDLYDLALAMARDAGFEEYFMGHRQHAGFIGHGVGIEVNELPVLSPRSRDVLTEGNAIALEPKFVIPGTGAVGVENTYIVTAEGLRCLTNAPEELITLQ